MARVKLTPQQQLAVMMTGTRSQRQLAAQIGVSHQRIGRWLRQGLPDRDGNVDRSRPPTDPDILSSIDSAFQRFASAVSAESRRNGLPFNPDLPVYARRVRLRTGELGDRVEVGNTHWLSDDMRRRVITAAARTQKYLNVSVRSVINLFSYNRIPRAPVGMYSEQARMAQSFRRHESLAAEMLGLDEDELDDIFDELDDEEDDEESAVVVPVEPKPVYTELTTLRGHPPQAIVDQIEQRLRTRHQPATGYPGTKYATAIVFQLDPLRDPIAARSIRLQVERAKQKRRDRERQRRAEKKARDLNQRSAKRTKGKSR